MWRRNTTIHYLDEKIWHASRGTHCGCDSSMWSSTSHQTWHQEAAADSGSLHPCKCETGLGIAGGQALWELWSAIKRVKHRERVVSPFTDATRRISVLPYFHYFVCFRYKCYVHCKTWAAREEHLYRHIFFFLRHYNFRDVLAFSTSFFHLVRFLMHSFQFVISIFVISLFTSSSHLFLGLPSDLVCAGDHLYTSFLPCWCLKAITKIKVSIRVIKYDATLTHGGMQFHEFLTSSLVGREWSASRPGSFIPLEKPELLWMWYNKNPSFLREPNTDPLDIQHVAWSTNLVSNMAASKQHGSATTKRLGGEGGWGDVFKLEMFKGSAVTRILLAVRRAKG